ncbi:thioredoxin [Pseudoscourfieldia marina]
MPPPLPASSNALRRALGSPQAPATLGCYLDFSCPFSAKMYTRLFSPKSAIKSKYVDSERLRLEFYHQVQPWHPQSALMHEAAIAAGEVGGDDAFWKGAEALMENRERFTDTELVDKTRREVSTELAALVADACGLEKNEVLSLLELDPEAIARGEKNGGSKAIGLLKLSVKYGRQNGIHVSPTTTWNGLVVDTSSGWDDAAWSEFLDPLLEKAGKETPRL